MAAKDKTTKAPRKRSKRERRQKFIIYLMIIAMLLSSITMGLAFFVL